MRKVFKVLSLGASIWLSFAPMFQAHADACYETWLKPNCTGVDACRSQRSGYLACKDNDRNANLRRADPNLGKNGAVMGPMHIDPLRQLQKLPIR